jgi:hypothetical protein
MLLHSNRLFWFRANQSLHLFLKHACLVEFLIYHSPCQYTTYVVVTKYLNIFGCLFVCLMVLNVTFNKIQLYWPGENHRPVASHWQTLSHNVVHLTLIEIRTRTISGDRYKSNYHMITATMNPISICNCILVQKQIKKKSIKNL